MATSRQKPSATGDPCANGLSYPSLSPHAGPAPTLPSSWHCTAILHPFSPPPEGEPEPDVPFFQLCTANIAFKSASYLSAQITGCEYGTWWYIVSRDGTKLSRDKGRTWTTVDVGWSLPTTNWFGGMSPNCAGSARLNWLQPPLVNWWKIPVARSNATTWMWFDSNTAYPFRLMFGQPPKNPAVGDPAQLALFQMFSFSYFPSFAAGELEAATDTWQAAGIPGFSPGNPKHYELVVWNPNFGMTTMMTPVDEKSDPLPTRVLYRWASDQQYGGLTDRAQSTLMWYEANPSSGLISETALMFGVAPQGVSPPAHSGSTFLIDTHTGGSVSCKPLPFGQEPPDWARIPAVKGTVRACIDDNPVLCPGHAVAVMSVLFPPTGEYPQGRYLWTWYSPFAGSNGSRARPITFMESASNIEEGGTSLALADYYDYREFSSPIPAKCFPIPDPCLKAPPPASGSKLPLGH